MSYSDQEIKTDEIYINLSDTQYQVLQKVAQDLGWRISFDFQDKECDVYWQDGALSTQFLSELKPYQRINHFPGMYAIARKDSLGRNLKSMKQLYPEQFNFFPPTWVIPRDLNDLRKQFNKKGAKTFIVKPEASCQGRGIFLTRKLKQIPQHCVVQRYLHKPFLLDGLKFDIRLYMLIGGSDPLRLYLHKQGLVRLATEPYQPPVPRNLGDLCMHLTNYAINKLNSNFEFNQDPENDFIGHKRSFRTLMKVLQEQEYDTERIWRDICDIACKVASVVQPLLSHLYRSSQAHDPSNMMCFQILGLDIFLDYRLRPFLLQVNHTPSFTTDTPLDHQIKYKVVSDSLKLLGLKHGNRKRFFKNYTQDVVNRATKKPHDLKIFKEEVKQKSMIRRKRNEKSFLGDFQLIFPARNAEQYQFLMKTGGEVCLQKKLNKKNVNSFSEATQSKIPPTPNVPKVESKKNIVKKVISFTTRKHEGSPAGVKSNQDLKKPVKKDKLPPLGNYLKPQLFSFSNNA